MSSEIKENILKLQCAIFSPDQRQTLDYDKPGVIESFYDPFGKDETMQPIY